MSERIEKASISKDDAGDLWLTYYTGDIRHLVKLDDVAKMYSDYVAVIKANAEVAELNADLLERVEAMRSRIKELEAEKTPCTWTQGNEMYDGQWETSCVNMFEFNSGTPEENEFKFCPYCGHPIVEKLYIPDEDE